MNGLGSWVFLTGVLVLPVAALGQSSGAAGTGQLIPGYGTITGHVICGDTRLPARFTKVVLERVGAKNEASDSGEAVAGVPVAETGLDGSFTIAHVRPGSYYVTAEKAGYISALAHLSAKDLERPDEEKTKVMARLLTPVSVAAGRVSAAEVTLFRGASLSGTVRFDDGTSDSAAALHLYRRDGSGRWKPFTLQPLGMLFGSVTTDDQGSFRVSGLPAGEYLVGTKLQVTTFETNDALEGFSTKGRESLVIFGDHATREKEAKVYKVSEGEDVRGVTIEIPLATLHTVAGHLVEAGSGRVINAGTVTLKHADDGSTAISTEVRTDDGAFQLAFVPEGEYTVSVSHARDVTRAPSAADPLHAGDASEPTTRGFADAMQPLVVTSDVADARVAAGAPLAKASADAGDKTMR